MSARRDSKHTCNQDDRPLPQGWRALFRSAPRKMVAATGAFVLLLVPLSIQPSDGATEDAPALTLRASSACAQGFGCAWDPTMEPDCPDMDPPYYCNFGCDDKPPIQ